MSNGAQQPTAGLQQTRQWSHSCCQKLFAIDLRSLALFRISIALVMLVDLARRAADLSSMYAEGGALPLAAVHDYYGELWKWSFHLWSDAWGYQALLFGLAGVCAVALLVGYQTRIVTCLAWILTCSLNTRAPLLVNGGEIDIYSVHDISCRCNSIDISFDLNEGAGNRCVHYVFTISV